MIDKLVKFIVSVYEPQIPVKEGQGDPSVHEELTQHRRIAIIDTFDMVTFILCPFPIDDIPSLITMRA
jgi:hypothetical protein